MEIPIKMDDLGVLPIFGNTQISIILSSPHLYSSFSKAANSAVCEAQKKMPHFLIDLWRNPYPMYVELVDLYDKCRWT